MKISYFEWIFKMVCLSFVSISVGDELSPNLLKHPELTINSDGPPPLFGLVAEDRVITFRGEDILVSSSLVSSLLITCSAHYPVYWDYDLLQEMTLSASLDPRGSSIRVNTYRLSDDFNDPSSYIHYAFLNLTADSRFITNSYTCRSMTNESLRTTRHIFWPGQKTNLGVGTHSSKSVMADSFLFEKNSLNGTANYAFDDTGIPSFGHHICCHNSFKATYDMKSVNVYVQNCRTKTDCKKIRGQMRNIQNMAPAKNCGRSMIKPGEMFGVFRCVGEDIDVTREFFLPQPFSNSYIDDEISKIPPQTFVSIKTGKKSSGSTYTVYSKLPVTIQCFSSTYLFTYGVRWSILWTNGTTQILPQSLTHLLTHPSLLATFLEQESTTLELKFDKDMKFITCHAPLLNSTGWVNKTLELNVTESVLPKIKGPDFELLTWKAGDRNKSLECESDGLGVPKPAFSWIHPWTETQQYKYNTSDAKNLKQELKLRNSSIIIFEIARPFMTGMHTCIVHSALGEVRKLFQVNVTDYNDRLTLGTTITSSNVVNVSIHASNTDWITVDDGPSSPSPTAPSKNQNSALVTTLIIISATLSFLLAGCVLGFVYILRRFKEQCKLADVTHQQSILPWKDMATASTIPYEEFFSL